jgi:hypothetical protein
MTSESRWRIIYFHYFLVDTLELVTHNNDPSLISTPVFIGSRCALTMMKSPTMLLLSLAVLLVITQVAVGFSVVANPKSSASSLHAISSIVDDNDDEVPITSRRSILTSAVSGAIILSGFSPKPARAVVGTLPEFADTNAIVQGVTIDVVDKAQQDNMIKFLVNGFDFQVLRKRIKGSVEETVGNPKFGFIINTLFHWSSSSLLPPLS